ncbi:helix-turn-helix transcriptional regulator [Azovibrio sp.]|uniref:helix-turn-helix transcriptional regulator n=1 Tax=Azovibrio sp. TaxID=1872673 RepID=UPI003C73D925
MKQLRVGEVAALLGVATVTIWKWTREGYFPQPTHLAPRVTVWDEVEIKNWIESKKGDRNGSSGETEGGDQHPDLRPAGATA